MRPLWQFLVRHYVIFLFVLLEGIAITIYINNSYYQKSLWVTATNNFTGFFFNIRTGITQYFSLKAINEQLSEENAELRSRQDGSYIKTDHHIFIHKDTLYRLQYQYITAKVINNTANKTANYLTLNKGAMHGIKKDMAVICPTGIVGVINEVSDNFCSVVSLLHPDTKISAKLKKNDYVGTVVWDIGHENFGKMKDVPIHVKIANGDTIITSGYSLLYPEGIIIGTIYSWDVGMGNDFYNIRVKLNTDFNNLKYVYIINNLMKEELEKLEIKARKQ